LVKPGVHKYVHGNTIMSVSYLRTVVRKSFSQAKNIAGLSLFYN